MKSEKEKKFIQKIVNNGKWYLEDFSKREEKECVKLGIVFSERTWKRIISNIKEIEVYAKTKNVTVEVAKDNTRTLFFKKD